METESDEQVPVSIPGPHFQTRLWERYQITLTEEDLRALKISISRGYIDQVSRPRSNGTAVFKYIHKPNTSQQTRIYVVAEVRTGRLISVEKPKWRHKKSNKRSKQKKRGLQ